MSAVNGNWQDSGPDASRFSAAPRMETDRLILRAFVRDDFEAFYTARTQPEVMRHITATPFSRGELWGKFLRGPGLWSLLGYGMWSIVRREDGKLIGEIGFADYQRDVAPPLPGPGDNPRYPTWPEAAWLLDSDAHGQGYAGEALAAALRWADAQLGVPLLCMIAPANAPSLKLAARNGFLVVGHRLHGDQPVLILQRNPGGAD